MIIECEVLNQPRVSFLDTEWSYNPLDPLVVEAKFGDGGPTWGFSLDLLMSAFTAPGEGLHGHGHLLIEAGEDFTIFHLSDGEKSASVQFSTADIQSFLEEIDIPSSDEVIASKLDEFLETL